ncbi:hypothetical protein [Gynurincola endophyticus]|uniref:hypothetical protein n=1 Tax=Gynurincola endophyticus TaxID=2479004 RepID=UPI000F8F4713|nr:hypothetical protein [Gynurincola endophyticus]
MYSILLSLHSGVRWLVLICILYALYRAYTGYTKKREFNQADNAIRHWTATMAHIQMIIGILLYVKSPVVQYFWKNVSAASRNGQYIFYALIHLLLMLTAIILLTIGSAKAKRANTAYRKYKIILLWFSLALLIILVAIPWPFSPLSNRPYFR